MKMSILSLVLLVALLVGASPSWADRLEVLEADGTWSKVRGTAGAMHTTGGGGGGGAGTEYTEDSAAADNPAGPMTMCRRRDTLTASEVSTDGDNIACNATSKGEIYVKQTDAAPVTQSGTWTVQPGNTANTTPWLTTIQQGGNAAAVNGSGQLSITCANCSGSGASAVDDAAFTPAVGSGAPAMGMFDDVSPDSVNEGDAGVVRMSANRNQYVTIRDAAGNERGLNIDASGNLTANINGTVTAVTTLTTLTGGGVAHDGADSGSPVKVGCHARTTNRTAVADADRADVLCDKSGKQVMVGALRERVVRSGVITLTNTTETTLIAAGGAGVFRDLTYLKCTNNSATLVRVDLRDATAGTVIDSWALAASGGGFNLTFPVPYNQATANNNWAVQLSASVTDVRCSAQAVENN